MFNKIKSTGGVTTLFIIGAVFIFLLYGNSASNISSRIQSHSDEKVSSAINTTDSFRCGTMDVYYKMSAKQSLNSGPYKQITD